MSQTRGELISLFVTVYAVEDVSVYVKICLYDLTIVPTIPVVAG
jgi:hypothetical protein